MLKDSFLLNRKKQFFLFNKKFNCNICSLDIFAGIAQSVECSLGKAEVTGSIPVAGSNDVSVRTNRTELIQNQSENKSG